MLDQQPGRPMATAYFSVLTKLCRARLELVKNCGQERYGEFTRREVDYV